MFGVGFVFFALFSLNTKKKEEKEEELGKKGTQVGNKNNNDKVKRDMTLSFNKWTNCPR